VRLQLQTIERPSSPSGYSPLHIKPPAAASEEAPGTKRGGGRAWHPVSTQPPQLPTPGRQNLSWSRRVGAYDGRV